MPSLLARLLDSRISQGVLTVVQPDGSTERFGQPASGWPEVTLRIHERSAMLRILRDPGLGLGECYMDGLVSVDDDDIMGLIHVASGNNRWERGPTIDAAGGGRLWWNRALKAARQANDRVTARANVAHHYDLSADFYRLWLDPEMQYSCAYWADGVETLEQAQQAKMAHIAAKLALQPGQRVLDIGCGWGGMARYLARVADVHVTGITLSTEQLAEARARAAAEELADRVTFELMDYRAFAETGVRRFDRIVSVGMFEHVGVRHFPEFFAACRDLLADDGVMLLHTIGRLGEPGFTDAFTRKYIFPGGYIPALSETLRASERLKLIASDVETLRLHYGRTLRAWYANVHAQRAAIEAMYDARFFRMWTFYLAGAAAAFEHAGMANHQVQYIRDRHALPITRDYMGEAELRLRPGGTVRP